MAEGEQPLNDFDYSQVTNLDEALDLLGVEGARAIAGGTDLLLEMRRGEVRPTRLVDVTEVPALRQIEVRAGRGMRIGAAVTMRMLEREATIAQRFLMLREAAGQIGSVQIRNLATLGGNLCNAAPSADMAPPLLALGARAIIAGRSGEREVALEEFFLGPGETVLERGELLVALEVESLPGKGGCCYQRITTRRAMDIAFVGVASAISLDEEGGKCLEARIALGAVAPTPIRAREAERALAGSELSEEVIEAAARGAAEAAKPISDVRASADYRREMVRVLARRTLLRCLEAAQAGGTQ